MKIDGRRIQVDYERGRTTKDWIPRKYYLLNQVWWRQRKN
jgi:hypothetical protein